MYWAHFTELLYTTLTWCQWFEAVFKTIFYNASFALFQFFETVVRYDRFFSTQTQHIPTVVVSTFVFCCSGKYFFFSSFHEAKVAVVDIFVVVVWLLAGSANDSVYFCCSCTRLMFQCLRIWSLLNLDQVDSQVVTSQREFWRSNGV